LTRDSAARRPLIVLTGASGSGKTAIAKAIENEEPKVADVFFFDRIGVPAPETMIAGWGSGEAWQKAMTLEWMRRLANVPDRRTPVLFEGQMRFSFIEEGLRFGRIDNARIILVDCYDRVRSSRLHRDRGQAELANPQVMSWAEHLRREARAGGYDILDTSEQALDQSVDRVRAYLSE
jgi:hypothetical protein